MKWVQKKLHFLGAYRSSHSANLVSASVKVLKSRSIAKIHFLELNQKAAKVVTSTDSATMTWLARVSQRILDGRNSKYETNVGRLCIPSFCIKTGYAPSREHLGTHTSTRIVADPNGVTMQSFAVSSACPDGDSTANDAHVERYLDASSGTSSVSNNQDDPQSGDSCCVNITRSFMCIISIDGVALSSSICCQNSWSELPSQANETHANEDANKAITRLLCSVIDGIDAQQVELKEILKGDHSIPNFANLISSLSTLKDASRTANILSSYIAESNIRVVQRSDFVDLLAMVYNERLSDLQTMKRDIEYEKGGCSSDYKVVCEEVRRVQQRLNTLIQYALDHRLQLRGLRSGMIQSLRNHQEQVDILSNKIEDARSKYAKRERSSRAKVLQRIADRADKRQTEYGTRYFKNVRAITKDPFWYDASGERVSASQRQRAIRAWRKQHMRLARSIQSLQRKYREENETVTLLKQQLETAVLWDENRNERDTLMNQVILSNPFNGGPRRWHTRVSQCIKESFCWISGSIFLYRN